MAYRIERSVWTRPKPRIKTQNPSDARILIRSSYIQYVTDGSNDRNALIARLMHTWLSR